MTAQHTQTVIVGGGQAGLALSHELSAAGHDHVVLERGRVGERWRSQRWPSLSLLTPNWLNRLPGSDPHDDPDGFLSGEAFVRYLEAYGRSFAAPVQEGTAVRSVTAARRGFLVRATGGDWTARNVVLASGDCDLPAVPALAAKLPVHVASLPSTRYRGPAALGAGGVLVVGAGPTGQQLALELAEAGREVVLAVGRHAGAPRRYRGRDIFEWLHLIGDLDRTREEVERRGSSLRSPSLAVTGANGGRELDLGVLDRAGVRIAGRLMDVDGTHARFAADLEESVIDAERRMRRVLTSIDAHIDATHLEALDPDPPGATVLPRAPDRIDLASGRFSTVIWATGYRRAYPWLKVPGVIHGGEVVHRDGLTKVPGLSVLGFKLQRRRNSHFIGGVGPDAVALARHLDRARPAVGPSRTRNRIRRHTSLAMPRPA